MNVMTDRSGPGAQSNRWEPLAGSVQAVVLEILRRGPQPRTQLAERLGLSIPSLSRITKPLLKTGMLLELESVRHVAGRPTIPLDLDASLHHFIGIKITTDGIYAVTTDQRGVVLREMDTRLTSTAPDDVATQLAGLISGLIQEDSRIRGACVSVGGTAEHRLVVGQSELLGWRNVPLAELISAQVDLPCWVENDVRALTHAEHWFGDGRNLTSFALVTVGAGIGAGIVIDDQVIDGAHAVAGSVGHHRLTAGVVPPGEVCELGHEGCSRVVLASDGIARQGTKVLGQAVSATDVVMAAAAGDVRAQRVVDLAATALGIVIADVVNFFDPDAVLLSGEMVQLASLGQKAMHEALTSMKHPAIPEPEIVVQDFQFNEWARGAAVVAIQMHALGVGLRAARTN